MKNALLKLTFFLFCIGIFSSMSTKFSTAFEKVKSLYVPVSLGELIDKLTILEIKSERIKNEGKLKNIQREVRELKSVLGQIKLYSIKNEKVLTTYYKELKVINETLWDIENNIRKKESEKQFDQEFIELARSVYITNDKRGSLKQKINILFHSKLREEKEYVSYQKAR